MIFESHAHYDDRAFDEDRDILLNSLEENGIGGVMNVGASLETTKNTIALIEKYSFVYGAAGVHPSHTGELTEENFTQLEQYCAHPKIAAVGEIGLDYYWKEPDKEIQKKWFARQLQLAGERKLPVILHSRDAARDTLDMVKSVGVSEAGGVIHCFSYGKEIAREYLEMDFYFGIGGVITFQNGRKLKEVVEYIPMEKILLETDSPYLAPVPYRGKRNSSLYLPLIAKEIAQIKGLDYDEVTETALRNTKRLFGIA